jgi:C1A family cysteine protease
MTTRKYPWRPDPTDGRDLGFCIPQGVRLPTSVDLRSSGFMPPVYDQGELGSCTANALAAAVAYERRKNKLPPMDHPSRLFIYYNERQLEGTVTEDSGAFIRDGVKSLHKWGVCNESSWPYDVARFTEQPTAQDYQEAAQQSISSYHRILTEGGRLHCLASGRPFVFGFMVYESFESDAVAHSGIVPMPKKGERCIGGHAVLCIGYDQLSRTYIVRNSWGPSWGQNGYFDMPFDYLSKPGLADDFWQVVR